MIFYIIKVEKKFIMIYKLDYIKNIIILVNYFYNIELQTNQSIIKFMFLKIVNFNCIIK